MCKSMGTNLESDWDRCRWPASRLCPWHWWGVPATTCPASSSSFSYNLHRKYSYLRNKLQCWMVHRGMNLNGHVIKYCEAWQGSNAIVKPYAYAMIILTLYSWIFDLLKSSHRNRFFCSLVSWYVYKERYFQM